MTSSKNIATGRHQLQKGTAPLLRDGQLRYGNDNGSLLEAAMVKKDVPSGISHWRRHFIALKGIPRYLLGHWTPCTHSPRNEAIFPSSHDNFLPNDIDIQRSAELQTQEWKSTFVWRRLYVCPRNSTDRNHKSEAYIASLKPVQPSCFSAVRLHEGRMFHISSCRLPFACFYCPRVSVVPLSAPLYARNDWGFLGIRNLLRHCHVFDWDLG